MIRFIFIFLFSCIIYAQQARDVIHLKNGSVIRGIITEMKPSENIKIQMADGSVFVYKMSEVLKMEKEHSTDDFINQNNSQIEIQWQVENYFEQFITNERPALRFIGVEKKNGVKREIYGQRIYTVEYEIILAAKRDIQIYNNAVYSNEYEGGSINFLDNFSYIDPDSSGVERLFTGDSQIVRRASRMSLEGVLNFGETDNGWRISGFKNNKLTFVAPNYIPPEMAIRIEEQDRKFIAQKKKEGDWKTADIDPIEIEPRFMTARNIPVFGTEEIEFSFEKGKTCNNCRNDNTLRAGEVVFKQIQDLQRYSNSDKSIFENAENQSKISIEILRIDYDFRVRRKEGKISSHGYQCKITWKAYINSQMKNPQDLSYTKSSDTKAAISSYTVFYSTKRSAFEKALSDLSFQTRKFIEQYAPMSLRVAKIETNRKGKPEYIIFDKPDVFFNLAELDFVVTEQKSILIGDKGHRIIKNLGQVKYRRKNYPQELKCRIRKSKMQKALKQYVGKEAALRGVKR